MSENSTEVKFGGDASGAAAAAAEAARAVKEAVGGMTASLGSLGNAFGSVKGMFIGLTAALGSFAVFKEAADETLKFTKEANALGRSLNVSANEAAVLIDALEDIGSNADEYSGAFMHFARQLKNNGAELRAMGVDVEALKNGTKSSNEVFREALQIVSQYKPGLDQAQASMAMFGRSVESVLKLQKMTNETVEQSRQKLESLGLTLTKEGQESAEKYRNAMRDMGDVFMGIKKAIGDAFMPVLTKLADWFNSIGPAAVAVTRAAVDSLATGFWLLKHAVTVTWEVINAMVVTVAEPIRAVAESVYHLLNGNYSAAGSAIAKVPKEISAAWQQANKEVNASASELDKKIGNLWGSGTPTEAKKGGDKSYTSKDTSDKQAADQKALNDAILDGQRALSNEEISLKRAVLAQQEAMGQISKEEQLLQLKALKDQEYQIEMQTLEQKLSLMTREGVEKQKLLDQIALAKSKHNTEIIKQDTEIFNEQKSMMERALSPISNAIQTSVTGIIMGTTTMKKALSNIFQSIMGEFVAFVTKKTMTWLAGEIALTGITRMWSGIRQALGFTEAAVTVATKTTEATAVVGANAAEAASGAAASQASIPYIGPELAAAAFAAMAGLVLGAKSMFSAKGGFDIPAGVNPVTQLHEREMVLPAEYADTIRSMAGGASMAGAGGVNVNINAVDARGVRDLFMRHGGDLTRSLAEQSRRFARLKS